MFDFLKKEKLSDEEFAEKIYEVIKEISKPKNIIELLGKDQSVLEEVDNAELEREAIILCLWVLDAFFEGKRAKGFLGAVGGLYLHEEGRFEDAEEKELEADKILDRREEYYEAYNKKDDDQFILGGDIEKNLLGLNEYNLNARDMLFSAMVPREIHRILKEEVFDWYRLEDG